MLLLGEKICISNVSVSPPFPNTLEEFDLWVKETLKEFEWAIVFCMGSDSYHQNLILLANDCSRLTSFRELLEERTKERIISTRTLIASKEQHPIGIVVDLDESLESIIYNINQILQSGGGAAYVSYENLNSHDYEFSVFDKSIKMNVPCRIKHIANITEEVLYDIGACIFPATLPMSTIERIYRENLSQDYSEDLIVTESILEEVDWFFAPSRSHDELLISLFASRQAELIKKMAEGLKLVGLI